MNVLVEPLHYSSLSRERERAGGEGARMIIITPQEHFFPLRPPRPPPRADKEMYSERFFRCRTSEAGVPGHSIYHKWPWTRGQ